ncbi:MAG: transposase, partial [Bacteroidales bacterium]|nr:transposase [Bacteroidales bacterium]
QNIAKLIGLIKGESSHWINQNKLTQSHFEWQDEYYAASISYSHLEAVRKYIREQEEHHKKVTWEQEYEQLLIKCGFERLKG